MNKFLTFAGTQPVYLGDIDFMQNASAAAVNQLLRSILNSPSNSVNAILQGVEFSYGAGGTISWTAGVVVLGGELLPIEAGSISAADLGALYFHVNSVLTGSRTFKDGQSHACYDTRTAIINTTSADGVSVNATTRFRWAENKVYDTDYTIFSADGVSRIVNSSPRLVLRSGLWLLDIEFHIIQNVQNFETWITFYNMRPEHLELLRDATFVIPVVLYRDNNGNDAYGQQLLKCQLVIDDFDQMAAIFKFTFAGDQEAFGDGRLQAMVPIF